MKIINGIIFDLGKVLIDVDLNRGILKHWSPNGKLNDNELLDQLFNDPSFLKYERGQITPVEFYQFIKKRLKYEIQYDEFINEWNDVFSRNLEMEHLFNQLNNRYPVGLLSDIDPIHWNFVFSNYPILRKIRRPVLSFQLGQVKPHPDCYKAAAHSLSMPIENCLFIDDRIKNVNGALAAGMQAVCFASVGKLVKELADMGIRIEV